MDFFSGLGKKVSNAAKQIGDKTKDSVEATRVSKDLKGLVNEMDALYRELGKTIFQQRTQGGEEDGSDFVEKIQANLAAQEQLRDQLDLLRDVCRCPACGAVQARGSRFCSACGTPIPAPAPKPDPEEGPAEYCTGCGAKRLGDNRFCIICGKAFDEADAPAAEEYPAAEEEPAPADESEV